MNQKLGSGPARNVDVSLLAVALFWGTSYLAAKKVATPDTVFQFLALRFGLSVGVLTLILLPRLRGTTRAELRLGAIFGAVLSLIFVLETLGVTQTTASNAGLIISLTILLTPLLERVVRGIALPGSFYVATLIAIAGVVALTQSGGFTPPRVGDLIILLAAGVRAVHITLMAHLSQDQVLDSRRLTFVQLATALVLFVMITAATGRGIHGMGEVIDAYTPSQLLLLVYLALVCTLFAFLVQLWAVRQTSPSRVSLLLGTEPLWAAVVGIGVGGDPFGLLTILGAGLVLAGTNWGRRIDSRRVERPEIPVGEMIGGRAPA
jgi:drug/metabolite transporter (DMT)-like permease